MLRPALAIQAVIAILIACGPEADQEVVELDDCGGDDDMAGCGGDADADADSDADADADGDADGPCEVECSMGAGSPCPCEGPYTFCDDGSLCATWHEDHGRGVCLPTCGDDAECELGAEFASCAMESECNLTDGTREYCGAACYVDTDCPPDMVCDIAVGIGLCYPEEGDPDHQWGCSAEQVDICQTLFEALVAECEEDQGCIDEAFAIYCNCVEFYNCDIVEYDCPT